MISRRKCHLHGNQAPQNHFKMTLWGYVIFNNQLHTDPLISHLFNTVAISKPFCTSLTLKKTRKGTCFPLRTPREFTAPIVSMGTRNRPGENSSVPYREELSHLTPPSHINPVPFILFESSQQLDLHPIGQPKSMQSPKGTNRFIKIKQKGQNDNYIVVALTNR